MMNPGSLLDVNGSAHVRGAFLADAAGLIARGAKTVNINANPNNTGGGGIAISDDGGFFDWNDGFITYENLCCAGGLRINANLTVMGTKSFVQPDPADPTKEINYVALEGPEAGTYVRGTARLRRGRATVELPGHFGRITAARGVTVQITPSYDCRVPILVVSKAAERIVVAQRGGADDCEFDYLVQGLRRGYEDHVVEREAPLRTQVLAAQAKGR